MSSRARVRRRARSPRRRTPPAASLRLRSRHAARLQIEQLLGIERADRRAVAADDVVGENLELGLVVHRRVRRQQDRLRLHAAVGLLRAWPDDHLALKHADASSATMWRKNSRLSPRGRRARPRASCRRGGARRAGRGRRAPIRASSPASGRRSAGARARRRRRSRTRRARRARQDARPGSRHAGPRRPRSRRHARALAPGATSIQVEAWRCALGPAPTKRSTTPARAPAPSAMARRE